MESAVATDPTTVLSTINTGLGALQVASVPTSSEPTTPSSESPLSLDASLREWLTEALVANSTNPKVYTKLLVSNAAAGSVIGKAGSNINDLQSKTFARIQLSKANEYFPGTTERTLLVTGRLKQVVAALGLIFSKLLKEGVAPLSPRSKAAAAFPRPEVAAAATASVGAQPAAEPAPVRLLVRLLVPQPLCGVIIGKNGVTIRNYAADTGTIIRVTSGEASQAATSHRIVTIAGEKEGVLKAIALMVLKQSDDPKFPLYSELPSPAGPSMQRMGSGGGMGMPLMAAAAVPAQHAFSMPAAPPPPQFHLPPGVMAAAAGPMGAGPGGGGAAAAAMYGGMPFVMPGGGAAAAAAVEGYAPLSLMLTEDQAGILLDQGGRAIVEVEQASGCRVRMDMADGPRGAFGRVMLAGPPEAAAYAQWMLGQRLAAAAASYQMGGTTYYSYGAMPAGGYAPAPPPPPGMAFMPASPFSLMQQQQQMMAAAAAAAASVGMMPLSHMSAAALRQHSGSSGCSTPGAP